MTRRARKPAPVVQEQERPKTVEEQRLADFRKVLADNEPHGRESVVKSKLSAIEEGRAYWSSVSHTRIDYIADRTYILPSWQRKQAWDEERRVSFVKSYLETLSGGDVHLLGVRIPRAERRHYLLDGQQRFGSCRVRLVREAADGTTTPETFGPLPHVDVFTLEVKSLSDGFAHLRMRTPDGPGIPVDTTLAGLQDRLSSSGTWGSLLASRRLWERAYIRGDLTPNDPALTRALQHNYEVCLAAEDVASYCRLSSVGFATTTYEVSEYSVSTPERRSALGDAILGNLLRAGAAPQPWSDEEIRALFEMIQTFGSGVLANMGKEPTPPVGATSTEE